ncbi:MAG: hypothetical protein JST93_14490 [Acidobacteria bacterium]|nr:hypothetical protein [Acidobacteriota bacterium]
MTLSELRTLATYLLTYDQDTYIESPSNSDWNALINQGIRAIARRLYLYEPKIILTTSAGVGRYDISDTTAFERKMLDVDKVVVSGAVLKNERSAQGLYSSIDWFDAKNPTWRTASNGTPTAAILLGQVLTFDKPASGVIANTFVSGRFIPNDLSADGQSPLLPTELHELVAYFAAVKFSFPNATEDEQWNRIKALDAKSVELLPELFVRQYKSVHGVAPTIVPGAQAVAQ